MEVIIKFKYVSDVLILKKGLYSQKNGSMDKNNCIEKMKA